MQQLCFLEFPVQNGSLIAYCVEILGTGQLVWFKISSVLLVKAADCRCMLGRQTLQMQPGGLTGKLHGKLLSADKASVVLFDCL